MEVLVLDTAFNAVGILDSYISLIWTDRYNQCSDFEITTPSDASFLNLLKPDYYLWFNRSDHVMIVEDFNTKTDVSDGNTIIFTGRSLESLLDRRIIWSQTNIDGNLQEGVKKLLEENVISPSDSNRKIDNFVFKSSEDERITSLKLTAQYTGDNLYDTICAICKSVNIGFKITLDDDNRFVFELYCGDNRSYSQDKNAYVVFSSDYENIINSDYLESKKNLKNVALVAGEGEGSSRKIVSIGATSGIDRRELFVDARDVSSSVDGGTLSETEYNNQLIQRGGERMSEYKLIQAFDGEMDTSHMYSYREDYFIGDIVQIKDKNGIEYSARIIEMIFSKNTNEESNYPTFEIMDANKDSSNNGNATSSGTMGSSGNSSGTIPMEQVSFYTKDDVDKLFLKKVDDVALTEDEINEICVWQ